MKHGSLIPQWSLNVTVIPANLDAVTIVSNQFSDFLNIYEAKYKSSCGFRYGLRSMCTGPALACLYL